MWPQSVNSEMISYKLNVKRSKEKVQLHSLLHRFKNVISPTLETPHRDASNRISTEADISDGDLKKNFEKHWNLMVVNF